MTGLYYTTQKKFEISYLCSNLWSRVQNTNAFSCALLWRVKYSSQFYCLMSCYFGAFSIFTGKADAKDFAVLVFTGNVISSEYGLTIYGHATVLRQWLLEKNTYYIIISHIPPRPVVRSCAVPRRPHCWFDPATP